MALESFGTETAKQVDHAVKLCHDLLKEHSVEEVNEMFKASDPPIWKVCAAYNELSENRVPVVLIMLGVG